MVPPRIAWLRALGLGSSSVAVLLGCSSAPTTAEPLPAEQKPPPAFDASVSGWAAVNDLGQNGTTGGEGGELVEVTTVEDFAYQAGLEGPRVILIRGVIGNGSRVTIGSHKTVLGDAGAEFHGGLRVDGGFNVIVRNLKIVGNNCDDVPVVEDRRDCSSGADAFSIGDAAHHVWVDHCDISNGSDGNLDVNDQADYVTVSWTKFSYSGVRLGTHQFSNLIGSGDSNPEDAGHLRVTFHHDWWAGNVDERMPRVRYGQVHIYNSLYSSSGNSYCVGVGFYSNILTEHNVFFNVNTPIESTSYSNTDSVVVSRGNRYVGTSGDTRDKGTNVFVPPYAYTLDAVEGVQQSVEDGAGTCAPPHVFTALPTPTCTAATGS